MPLSQDKIRIKIDTPLGKDVVWIVKFYGEESISSLFQFTAEVASDKSDVDFKKLLGKNVTVTLVAADKTECFIDGTHSSAERGSLSARHIIGLPPYQQALYTNGALKKYQILHEYYLVVRICHQDSRNLRDVTEHAYECVDHSVLPQIPVGYRLPKPATRQRSVTEQTL